MAKFFATAPVTSVPAAKPAPIMSPTANAKPDPTSKKDDGLMTEVPSTIAKQVAAGTAAGVTYIDTAQDSVFLAAVRVGGECNPSAKVLNDLHLVGAHGMHFDFNGRPDKAFCLLTDRNLHINMLLRGYYSDSTENAALVVDGKAVHTWIK
ncbi:unnamed protein product [Closterium sp. NIES-64]|nr:unnamed protein product [Closterium sp. NIES-64]